LTPLTPLLALPPIFGFLPRTKHGQV